MPLTHLTAPDGSTIPLDQAPQYFEDAGIMPGDAVVALAREGKPDVWPFIAPYAADPSLTCRRKIVLERSMPYGESPDALWRRMEGGLWHSAFSQGAKAWPGWRREVKLPGPEHRDMWNVRRVRMIDGKPQVIDKAAPDLDEDVWQVLLFPVSQSDLADAGEMAGGWWTNVIIDLLKDDGSAIGDHKSTRAPWHPWQKPPKQDFGVRDAREVWPIQLNLYRRVVEALRLGKVQELFVWRFYRGADKEVKVFTRFAIPLLSDGDLWTRVREHVTTLQGWLNEASALPREPGLSREQGLDALLSHVPLDGKDKNLFGGWLCNEGCPQEIKARCFAQAGRTTF